MGSIRTIMTLTTSRDVNEFFQIMFNSLGGSPVRAGMRVDSFLYIGRCVKYKNIVGVSHSVVVLEETAQ